MMNLLLILLTISFFAPAGMPASRPKNYQHKIDSLLKKLGPVDVKHGSLLIISEETEQEVRDKLTQIANESENSRAQVVNALIKILEEGSFRQGHIAYRWTLAVNLLGDLKAMEAIDILIKSINQTGLNDFGTMGYHPVMDAIIEIGEPAIPKLIEALADKEPIHSYAAESLARIGRPAFPKLKDALKNSDAEIKGGVALALAWIGGDEAKAAIEQAIAAETDPKALSNLNDALKEMHRFWGN